MMPGEKRKKGDRYCCIPGCRTSSNNKGKVFKIPTLEGKRLGLKTKEWAINFHQVVFRYRYDAKFKKTVLGGKANICSQHFEPSDIIQTSHRSHLQLGSLPTLNLPTKSHQCKRPDKRREITKHALPDNKIPPPRDAILSVSDIINNWKPNQIRGWRMHQISSTMVHFTHYQCDILHASPSISLLITEKGGELHFSTSFGGVYAPNLLTSLSLETSMSLKCILQYLLSVRVCSGYDFIPDTAEWCYRKVPYLEGGDIMFKTRFFNKNCEISCSGDSPACSICSKAYIKSMFNYENRLRHKEDTEGVPLVSTAPLSKCRRDRWQSTVTTIRKKSNDLQVELRKSDTTVSASIASVINRFSKTGTDNFLKEWWNVQKQLHDTESTHGRRYPLSVIKYCLMLYAKSPSAYRLAKNVMVLPCDKTLRNEKAKALNKCKVGIQDGAVARIFNAFKSSKTYHEQFAVLCMDEMTIKEDLAYQSSTGNVIGYVEYESDDLNRLSATSERVASQMLAFLVRGVTNKNLDGVVAFYPTSGATADDLIMLLHNLLVQIPLRTSITIVGVVFDGLQANRSLMKTLCQKEEDGSPEYRMKNPVDVSRYIYFLPDPPHLLKTTRNNLLNKKKCMWNNGHITMEPIKDLVLKDIARGDLRFFPQLTESHISPSTWEKMNVKIAAQTLSSTLGSALSETHPALSKFLLTMDRWFDIVNAGFQGKKFKPERRPLDSLEDERIHWLENDFPQYLKEWRDRAYSRPLSAEGDRSLMLLSRQTEEGLKIATKSIVAIIKECLEMGADYVLPRRINQDPLEAYFGYQREKVSRGDTPSASLFSATARSSEVLRLPAVAGSNVCLNL